MAQTFACPECRAELNPSAIGPARQMRCGRCGTLIEVPFFPRRRRKPGRGHAWLAQATWGGVILVVLFAVGFGAIRLRAALPWSTHTHRPSTTPALSRTQAEAQVAEVEAQEPLDPEAAITRASALLEQLQAVDMEDLAERLRSLRTEARNRWFENTLSEARGLETKDPVRAVALCETARRIAGNLPPGRIRQPIETALALAARVADRAGVVLNPAHGRFLLGSPQSYNSTFHPRLADVLRSRGYVPLAAGSPFWELWQQHAPYRMTIEITEEPGDYYLQSRNRTSHVVATFVLSRNDAPIWTVSVSGRTQVPLPNLRAFEDSRLAISTKHSPEVEHRFHENAVKQMLERLTLKLRDLPAPR